MIGFVVLYRIFEHFDIRIIRRFMIFTSGVIILQEGVIILQEGVIVWHLIMTGESFLGRSHYTALHRK